MDNSQQSGQQTANNAIYVNLELVEMLKAAVSKEAKPWDRLPSNRRLLDLVVAQTTNQLIKSPIYSVVRRDKEKMYKWFDSELAQRIQSCDQIVDKGRFVDACIIAYLSGNEGIRKYCVASRAIRPRIMTPSEISSIAETAAGIAAAKSVESTFEPGSLKDVNLE